MQPIQESSGLLFSSNASGERAFLGSCFSYKLPNLFLTAHHCIAGVSAGELGIGMPVLGNVLAAEIGVVDVIDHPQADVAVLVARPERELPPHSMTNVDWASGWGEPIVTFGYPEDTSPTGVMPTPRMLQGSIQRFFDYDDGRGVYRAIEMSVPAPSGLSGSPVSRIQDTGAVIGVVAANHTALTYSGSFETTDRDGAYRVQERDVVRYGIAVYLPDIMDWLDEKVSLFAHVA